MVDLFWSRVPGKFVDKHTGNELRGATFTGSTREWYETLVEVMIDVGISAQEQISGTAPLRYLNWVGDPAVCVILECSVLFNPFLVSKEVGTLFRSTAGILSYTNAYLGVIANLPVQSSPVLKGSRRLELVQFHGTEHERIVGSVTVVD